MTLITKYIRVQKKDNIVYYFNGMMPIFQHEEKDIDGFRYITSQSVINGDCKQADIINCFGVSPITVKRWVKHYSGSKGLGDFVSKKKDP